MKRLYLLTAGSLLILLTAKHSEGSADLWLLLTWLLLALSLAVCVRPSVEAILTARRLPDGAQWRAILFGIVMALGILLTLASYYELILLIDRGFVRAGEVGRKRDVADLLGYVMLALIMTAAMLPAVRLLAVADPVSGVGDRPLWPGYLGLFAALPLLLWNFCLILLMRAYDEPGRRAFMELFPALPALLLLLACGSLLWWRACRAEPADLDIEGGFPLLARVAIAIVLGCLALLIAGVAMLPGTPDTGQISGAVAFAIIAVSWWNSLRAVANHCAESLLRLSIAAFALIIGFAASMFPVHLIIESGHSGQMGDAGAVMAVLLTLVVPLLPLAVVGVILLPRLLARVLLRPGDAAPNPAATR